MMTTTNAACRQKLKTNEPDRLCVVTRPQHRHTHRGDGGVNCNSAALTGPSLNNRKAEMCQKYKIKQSLRTRGRSNQLHPSHTWWEVFTGRHNPRNHISIFIIIIIIMIIIFTLWYEHQGYRLPLSLTSHLYCQSTGASPRCVRYRMNMWWFYTDSSWKFNLNSRSAL